MSFSSEQQAATVEVYPYPCGRRSSVTMATTGAYTQSLVCFYPTYDPAAGPRVSTLLAVTHTLLATGQVYLIPDVATF